MDFSLCDPRVVPFGVAVSWLVEFLKRWPVLRRFPKVLALLLALVVATLEHYASPAHALPLSQIVSCALLIFGGAVLTHEVVTEPLQREATAARAEK